MTTEHTPTLERIRSAAEAEFLKYGFRSASLRRIVRSVGMTTGAFYGYYKSKEELFAALVGEHYDYVLARFREAQEAFAALPHERQPEELGEISGTCMFDMLRYAYAQDVYKRQVQGHGGSVYQYADYGCLAGFLASVVAVRYVQPVRLIVKKIFCAGRLDPPRVFFKYKCP